MKKICEKCSEHGKHLKLRQKQFGVKVDTPAQLKKKLEYYHQNNHVWE